MHDIVTGQRTVEAARAEYAREFADVRRKQPAPYMERLHFTPPQGGTAAPDERMLTDADLERAQEEGERRG